MAVNAQGGSVANDGLIQGKTGTAVAAKTDVNNGESGKIVSPAGDVTVNTETGNVDNKGVIDGQQATSVTQVKTLRTTKCRNHFSRRKSGCECTRW
ncbi:hypothetical protein DLJ98_00310 [Haemophilus influenzae]|nr:hypothetical protein DLJ98_00310 [Haemophilus influenzae]